MRRVIAIIFAGCFVAMPAYAAAPTVSTNYEVEVLVFDTQLPELEGTELWTRTAQPTTATTVNVESLPPTADFSSVMNSMRIDGRYRVLLHKHWTQAAESKSDRPPVQLATADNEISGIVRFYLSRFLHLELNVSYQPQTGAIGNGSTNSQANNSGTANYFINEQRRIKSNEMNYFDHPKFGVLVRVTPVAG